LQQVLHFIRFFLHNLAHRQSLHTHAVTVERPFVDWDAPYRSFPMNHAMAAMGNLCFSTAPILRCDLLYVVQYGVLIIPAGLELLFATALVITFWSRGR
jgi:hypothetical protein